MKNMNKILKISYLTIKNLIYHNHSNISTNIEYKQRKKKKEEYPINVNRNHSKSAQGRLKTDRGRIDKRMIFYTSNSKITAHFMNHKIPNKRTLTLGMIY